MERNGETAFASIDELLELGVLQEANRLFFHVLGLELCAVLDPNEGLVLRVRDEGYLEGGVVFGHHDPEWSEVRQERARRVSREFEQAMSSRRERYGFELQPIEKL